MATGVLANATDLATEISSHGRTSTALRRDSRSCQEETSTFRLKTYLPIGNEGCILSRGATNWSGEESKIDRRSTLREYG
ncbi:hypothetical protein V1478_013494 [Vespula squamosa]|uniref:Uncharacterized protein n=1 Tax=Vespula squamosa TaxID=30214 RepID=A0ABD2AAZ8_VESSQ